ncbi:cysteine desulfurase family protein [Magnetovibrio sp. PR-2]|uniref:cysteine desulfurase family protein n=1 Tax=Magnetovibrio sp. PR-2 TaxID=3120356 RepID=UPI002FCE40B1
MSQQVYMDHNATSPTRPKVRDAVVRAMEAGGNPSSVHASGRKARRAVEDAREQIRTAVNAPKSAQIVFTSCGTEANTLALTCTGRDKIWAGATDHAAVLRVADHVEIIPVDVNGLIDPFQLDELFAGGGDDVVVSVMLANNETGVLQQLEGIANIAHRYSALVHTDAVQALGKVDVDFESLGVDMMSVSAHKIGGPLGVGALIATKDVDLTAINPGGGQEKGVRGGTENVPGIVGFGLAAEIAIAELAGMAHVKALRDTLEARILDCAPDATVIAQLWDRLPNTSFIAMPGVDAETQVMNFDLEGIAVSAGSACASGKTKSSAVLTAMGLPADIARSAVRVSLAQTNKIEEIEHFISVWTNLYQRKNTAPNTAQSAA